MLLLEYLTQAFPSREGDHDEEEQEEGKEGSLQIRKSVGGTYVIHPNHASRNEGALWCDARSPQGLTLSLGSEGPR